MSDSSTPSQDLSQLTIQLSPTEQNMLQKGQAVVAGSDGKYVGSILVDASPDVAWEVLTDYDNLANFLPTTSSSRVLEEDGDRKVVEQVDSRQVFLMNVESRLCLESVEHLPESIQFRMIDGDHLKEFQGYWQVQPIEDSDNSKVLITQTVEADIEAGFLEGKFYELFESSLKDNLIALQKEVERRSKVKTN